MNAGIRDGRAGPEPRDAPEILRHEGIASEADLRRRYGTTAGILFIAGGLLSLPSSLLLGFRPAAAAALISAAAVLSGVVCLAAPWARLSWRWFHPAILTAVALIALGNAAADRTYAIYYVFPALFAAYVFRSVKSLASHLAVISLAMLGPLLYSREPARLSAISALAGIPAVVLLAATLFFLRTRLEETDRAYRRLAEEAVRVSLRLRGHDRTGGGDAPDDPAEEAARLREIATALESRRTLEERAKMRPGPIPSARRRGWRRLRRRPAAPPSARRADRSG